MFQLLRIFQSFAFCFGLALSALKSDAEDPIRKSYLKNGSFPEKW